MSIERLNKFLANSGVCSRRKADEYILAGKVKINGITNKELGIRVDTKNDVIEFDGKIVKPATDFIYFVLNKPKGVVSTAHDENGQKTVVDLVPKTQRVYPVGRLDKDTVGLIVLTNDGELTKELTHPSFEHRKEYKVEVRIMNRELGEKDNFIKSIEQKLTSRLKIDGKIMRADSVQISLLPNSKFLILNLVLHTGYNRQIRKMCAKIGLEVTRLTRVGYAKLQLDELNLNPGEFKQISRADII